MAEQGKITVQDVRAYCQRRAGQMEATGAKVTEIGRTSAAPQMAKEAKAAQVAYEQVIGWIDRGGDG